MQLRDQLGTVYADARFAALFAVRGRPAEAPWRLALVTVLQFAEGLSDRQAADAVRGRLDWKYALGLALDDPGFHYSVLCEFRARLLGGGLEHLLLEELLAACRAQALLRRRGRQRTDSTHVLGALRLLNRLEQVAETVRAALEALAVAAPDWLRARAPADWYERYGRRVEDYRLPQGQEARAAFARQVGEDGLRLLTAVFAPEAPPALRALPAVEILRRTWVQRYLVRDGQVRLREPKDQPPAAAQIASPYEDEARFATKRSLSWVGYRVHLTETCDDDLPHLVTDVGTTVAPAQDVDQLGPIQARLAARDLLPAEHVVDTGYVRAGNLVTSSAGAPDRPHRPGVRRPRVASQRPRRLRPHPVPDRLGGADRHLPQRAAQHRLGAVASHRPPDPDPRPVRARRLPRLPRPGALHPGQERPAPPDLLAPVAEHDALLAARHRQTTAAFRAQYAARAGIEGTLSQGVRAFGLRRCRYRGLAKAHLQQIATAAALNVSRLADWWDGHRPVKRGRSAFAALACLN